MSDFGFGAVSQRPLGSYRRTSIGYAHSRAGMSGAPVVRTSDGLALGVHWGGLEATMALAVPLDKPRLISWLAEHDRRARGR